MWDEDDPQLILTAMAFTQHVPHSIPVDPVVPVRDRYWPQINPSTQAKISKSQTWGYTIFSNTLLLGTGYI